jgi:hypothetical protein
MSGIAILAFAYGMYTFILRRLGKEKYLINVDSDEKIIGR